MGQRQRIAQVEVLGKDVNETTAIRIHSDPRVCKNDGILKSPRSIHLGARPAWLVDVQCKKCQKIGALAKKRISNH